jgi:N-acetylmuramoyl-L-alanine amidase
MVLRLFICLLSLAAAPSIAAPAKAEALFNDAKKAYRNLKADSDRRQFRHHWKNVAKKFEAVADRFPESKQAPSALYTAADLLVELSRISQVSDDLEAAITDYQKVMKSYPKNRLADDAALALAKIYVERLSKPGSAREVLSKALKELPKGDQASQMKSLLASLGRHEKDEKKGREKDEPEHPLEDIKEGSRKAVRERLKSVARQKSPDASLAEQLGLKVRRVVIDPGHGGHDSGAIGRSGVKEKDVALSIALKLKERLLRSGLDVVLTREDDRFVPLEARASIANKAKGDLFISIHCNSASRRSLRGIETYTLNTAGDKYSIRLAARENSASERRISDLQFILADLATKANTDESGKLAEQVQKSLVSDLSGKYSGVRDLGTKEALFYVLLGAKMPAILVETSFLSHPEEERRLRSSSYQRDLARAIASGIGDFLEGRQHIAQVD